MNRVRDPRFPKTVCDVVYQGHYRDTGCQFTFTCDGSLRHTPYGEAWDRAKAVALNVALGLSKPITNKATHYHTDYVNPYWKAGMVETKVIGTHIFYRFPKTSSEWTTARINLEAQEQRNMAADADLLAVSTDAPAASDAQPQVAAASLVQISAKPIDAVPQAASRSRRRPSALSFGRSTFEIEPDIEVHGRVRKRARRDVIDPRLSDRPYRVEAHPA